MASSLSSSVPTSHTRFHFLSNPITPPISIKISRFSSKVLSHESSFSYGGVGRVQLRRSRCIVFANPKEGDIDKQKLKRSEVEVPLSNYAIKTIIQVMETLGVYS